MTVSDCARAALVLLVLAASAVMARDIEVSSEVSSESDPMCTTTPPYFVNLQTKKAISTPFLRWTEFGPGMSGYSDKFFVHPSNPNTMHVASVSPRPKLVNCMPRPSIGGLAQSPSL
jgi:hypothetical protein